MTNHQIQLVEQRFELITPVLESATTIFYDRLFQLDPSLRSMFRSPKEEQARKLAHVLTVVVKGLNKLEQILPAVKQLGRHHSSYGVRSEHNAAGGAALLWTLQSGLGEAFTPEVRDAWASAYSLLSSNNAASSGRNGNDRHVCHSPARLIQRTFLETGQRQGPFDLFFPFGFGSLCKINPILLSQD